MSLKNKLVKFIASQRGELSGTELEDYGRTQGFKSSTVARRLRELAEEGAIEAVYNNRYVGYKSKKQVGVPENTQTRRQQGSGTPVESTQEKLFKVNKERT